MSSLESFSAMIQVTISLIVSPDIHATNYCKIFVKIFLVSIVYQMAK